MGLFSYATVFELFETRHPASADAQLGQHELYLTQYPGAMDPLNLEMEKMNLW